MNVRDWLNAAQAWAAPLLPTPEDVAQMRERHEREVIDVHPGYGEEAWCPGCRVHWPCDAARLLALADSLLTHGSASQQVQALPAALAALRAVLDLTDQDPLLRGDEIVTAIATALGVSDA